MKKIYFKEILAYITKQNIVRYSVKEDGYISDMANLQELSDHVVCWIKNKNFYSDNLADEIKKYVDVLVVCPFEIPRVNCIITDYPKGVFFDILNHFFDTKFQHIISRQAVILTDKIGDNVHIGANCYIGENVEIGDNTIIHPNVTIISTSTIGHDCEIFPGVVIGTDGFGYFMDNDEPHREKHFRGVKIGDYVDIGANTCIDRGLLTDTTIGNHVKIDNLCHIGHNVLIDDNCLIIAGSIICGSAHIKKNAYLSPGSTVLNQITVDEYGKVGSNSLAIGKVKAGTTVFGVPGKCITGK